MVKLHHFSHQVPSRANGRVGCYLSNVWLSKLPKYPYGRQWPPLLLKAQSLTRSLCHVVKPPRRLSAPVLLLFPSFDLGQNAPILQGLTRGVPTKSDSHSPLRRWDDTFPTPAFRSESGRDLALFQHSLVAVPATIFRYPLAVPSRASPSVTTVLPFIIGSQPQSLLYRFFTLGLGLHSSCWMGCSMILMPCCCVLAW